MSALTNISSQQHYQPLVGESEFDKLSLYELSQLYSKYLGLLRLPFRCASTLLGWVKILPISAEIRAIIGAQDAFIRSVNATLKLPKSITSQVSFYYSFSELLSKKTTHEKDSGSDLLSPRFSELFYNSLSLAVSWIKLFQLSEKFKWTRLGKAAPFLPPLLAKSSNVILMFLSARGLYNGLSQLNKQVSADYSSGRWASEGLSPKTKKTITTVASKGLHFTYLSSTTAALFFGVTTNPVLLMAIATTSLFLNVVTNASKYKKLIWESRPAPVRDLTTHLPA